ncbi:Integrator complex subunit 4 [Irineochytrium annulatum]|nr:Integrator complex subunit 4 [Irineochytrium annulatum]
MRLKAATLLGAFHQVPLSTAFQSLDKELRVDKKGRNHFQPSACGAFVLGLEDEYEEVRRSTVEAICELSVEAPPLARNTMGNLIDMFNDESSTVRLSSIRSLKKMALHNPLTLDDVQLSTFMTVLDDANPVMRKTAYEMLSLTKIKSMNGMRILTDHLRKNMEKYPNDRDRIFRCFGEIGRVNHAFIDELKAVYLSLDRRFLPIEKEIKSLDHVANIIMIYNAAFQNPSMLPLLPKYTFRHFHFLFGKMPECFDVEKKADAAMEEMEASSKAFAKYFPAVLDNIHIHLQRNRPQHALRLLTGLSGQLEALHELKGKHSHVFRLMHHFVSCYLDVLTLQSMLTSGNFDYAHHCRRIVIGSHAAGSRFMGLPKAFKRLLEDLRTFARIAWELAERPAFVGTCDLRSEFWTCSPMVEDDLKSRIAGTVEILQGFRIPPFSLPPLVKECTAKAEIVRTTTTHEGGKHSNGGIYAEQLLTTDLQRTGPSTFQLRCPIKQIDIDIHPKAVHLARLIQDDNMTMCRDGLNYIHGNLAEVDRDLFVMLSEA